MDRRFLLQAAGTLALGELFKEGAIAQGFRDKSLMYDVQTGFYKRSRDAVAQKNRLARSLRNVEGDLYRHVLVDRVRGGYTVLIDTNTTADHIEGIIETLKSRNIIASDSFGKIRPFFFNDNSTQGRNAYLTVGDNLTDLVIKYTTAFGPQEVGNTTRSLNRDYRSIFGRNARVGDIVPVPVRWLKTPYQLGMELEKDYRAVELRKGQTLYDVASEHTRGNIDRNVEVLRRFNEIKRDQLDDLAVGTPIMIPRRLYSNPEDPIIVNVPEDDSEPAIVVPSEPLPTRPEQDEALEERIPEISDADDSAKFLREKNLGVLRSTNMPAVLTESFNIQNFRQRKFYSEEDNVKRLAEAYAQGVLAYKQNHRNIDRVIVDNGHGVKDPGAIHRASGMSEGQFTIKIQKYMVDYLKRHGLKVLELNYDGRASPRARVNYYVREANKFGNGGNSVYVATHIDSMNSKTVPPPRVFVHSDGRQVYSTKLAKEMLARAVPFFRANF